MFGAYQFGAGFFADSYSYLAPPPPPASHNKGWVFDSRMQDALSRTIRDNRFDLIDAEDEADLRQVLVIITTHLMDN
jgi:hypothetical protein